MMNAIFLSLFCWMHHASGNFDTPVNLSGVPANPLFDHAAYPSWLELRQHNFSARDVTAVQPSPTRKQTRKIYANPDAKTTSTEALDLLLDEGRRSRMASDERTLTLRRVVRALEKLTKFLVRNAEEANFDAMMGIRMVQGHFKQLLAAMAQSEGSDWLHLSGINDWMQQTVIGLHERLDAAAKRIGAKAMDTNTDYFTRFWPLVTVRFWQGWSLPPPITGTPSTPPRMPREEGERKEAEERILRGKEQLVERESDECMAELLPVPTLSIGHNKRQAGHGGGGHGGGGHGGAPTRPKDDHSRVDHVDENEVDVEDKISQETIEEDAGVVDEVRCMITRICWSNMTAPGSGGYSLTHQLLYLIIGRLAGCEDILETMATIAPQTHPRKDVSSGNLDSRNMQDDDVPRNDGLESLWPRRGNLRSDGRGHLKDSPVKQGSVLGELMRDQCSTILWEANILADAGFPEHRRDLFMEQGFLCGWALFSPEFFVKEWVDQVLQWQHPNGCYGLEEDHVQTSTQQTQDEVFSRKTHKPLRFWWENRSKEQRLASRTINKGQETLMSRVGGYSTQRTRRLTLHEIFHKLDPLEQDFLENIRWNSGGKTWLSESESKQVGLKKHLRSKRSEQIMSDQCQAHRSAVALGYLSMALRYLSLGS